MLSIIETHEEFKQNLKESRETKTKRYKEKQRKSYFGALTHGYNKSRSFT